MQSLYHHGEHFLIGSQHRQKHESSYVVCAMEYAHHARSHTAAVVLRYVHRDRTVFVFVFRNYCIQLQTSTVLYLCVGYK